METKMNKLSVWLVAIAATVLMAGCGANVAPTDTTSTTTTTTTTPTTTTPTTTTTTTGGVTYTILQRVTNKGSVLPEAYYNLTGEMVRLGMASKEPVQVRGQTVVPYDFAIAFIIRERERILKEVNLGGQRGCVSVVVRGTKDGRPREYRFHMASTSQALGEGTGIPAAMGAILMQQGKVQGRRVLPPEACLNAFEFLTLARTMFAKDAAAKSSTEDGFIVEEIDEAGRSTRIRI